MARVTLQVLMPKHGKVDSVPRVLRMVNRHVVFVLAFRTKDRRDTAFGLVSHLSARRALPRHDSGDFSPSYAARRLRGPDATVVVLADAHAAASMRRRAQPR